MWDLIERGGLVMAPIILGSIVALAIVLERLWALRRSRVLPDDFYRRVEGLLADKRVSEARATTHPRTATTARPRGTETAVHSGTIVGSRARGAGLASGLSTPLAFGARHTRGFEADGLVDLLAQINLRHVHHRCVGTFFRLRHRRFPFKKGVHAGTETAS